MKLRKKEKLNFQKFFREFRAFSGKNVFIYRSING